MSISHYKKIKKVYEVNERFNGNKPLITNFRYLYQAEEYVNETLRIWRQDYGRWFDDETDYIAITKIVLKKRIKLSDLSLTIFNDNTKKETILYDK